MDDDGSSADQTPLLRRLGWMALIWVASVALLGALAYVLRLWLSP